MIKELVELGTMIGSSFMKKHYTENVKKDIAKSGYLMSQIAGKSNSIAKMASKTIHNYPVVITNAFGDEIDTAFKIVKYAESVFAYFLIMSIGLEPKIDNAGNSIAIHLSRFSAENWEKLSKESKIKMEIDLKKSGSYSPLDQYTLEELYENSIKEYATCKDQLKKWDYIRSSEDILDDIKYETETVADGKEFTAGSTGKYYDTDTLREVDRNGIYIKPNGTKIQDSNGQFIIAKEYGEGEIKDKMKTVQKDVMEITSLDHACKNLEKKIGKSLPTTFTVTLYVGEHKTPVTLSTKAIPHFIESDEMKGIFKRIVDENSFGIKLIKLKTGEISFFKDFLLSWSQIKSDQEFFQRVGRHSWYRKLLDRKLNSRAKGLMGMIDAIKQFMNGKETVLPTVTLVTTTSEISDAMSYPYLDAVKKGKVTKIIDSLMLLALIVYDQDRNLIHCHFNGIEHPYMIQIKELKSESKEDDMVKLMDTMTKLMMKSY